jgi:hypothetical protein
MSLTAGAGTRCMSLLPDSPLVPQQLNMKSILSHMLTPEVIEVLFLTIKLKKRKREKTLYGVTA